MNNSSSEEEVDLLSDGEIISSTEEEDNSLRFAEKNCQQQDSHGEISDGEILDDDEVLNAEQQPSTSQNSIMVKFNYWV